MTRRIDLVLAFAVLASAAALALPAGVGWDGLSLGLWIAMLAAIAVLESGSRSNRTSLFRRPRESGDPGATRMSLAPGSPLSRGRRTKMILLERNMPPGLRRWSPAASAGIALLGSIAGAAALYRLIEAGARGVDAPGLWLGVVALAALVWRALERSATAGAASSSLTLAAPVLFGIWLVYLWQVVTVGFAIPSVLLPPPSQIAIVLAGSLGVLGEDFVQTFVKSMIPGYVIGCGSGFLVAVLIDRVPFLQRGLLPVGNLASALPIVGIAPIMVMWFGFDWLSKAAVVAIMTFFPMLVNTLAGLGALGRVERDLMRSYGAGYGETLLHARLPAALPFIFNALKVNSTLALIGAIVAEFFGTPIHGMGFRISAGVGRMDIALVWATIVVAAVTGSASYGLLAELERRLTFWHPSFRKGS
jgi:NitT/TauT family transport system permease protein